MPKNFDWLIRQYDLGFTQVSEDDLEEVATFVGPLTSTKQLSYFIQAIGEAMKISEKEIIISEVPARQGVSRLELHKIQYKPDQPKEIRNLPIIEFNPGIHDTQLVFLGMMRRPR